MFFFFQNMCFPMIKTFCTEFILFHMLLYWVGIWSTLMYLTNCNLNCNLIAIEGKLYENSTITETLNFLLSLMKPLK